MPQISIAIYLNDIDYKKYQKDKAGYNEIARTTMLNSLRKVK